MWTTRDGYELVLPRAGVDAVATRLARGRRGSAVRRAVVDAVGQLAQSAWHAPEATAGGQFVAERGARRYDIAARPIGPRTLVITAIRPSTSSVDEEFRLPDGATVSIAVTWLDRVPAGDFMPSEAVNRGHALPPSAPLPAAFSKRGVYVLCRATTPIYVGQTEGDSFVGRWQKRMRTFAEFGVPAPGDTWVHAGVIEHAELGAAKQRGKASRARRITNVDVAEVIVIRQMRKAGVKLNQTHHVNDSGRLVVAPGQSLTFTNTGPKPAHVADIVNQVGPFHLELPALETEGDARR